MPSTNHQPSTVGTDVDLVHHLTRTPETFEGLLAALDDPSKTFVSLCGVSRRRHPNPLSLPPCEDCHVLAFQQCPCEEVGA